MRRRASSGESRARDVEAAPPEVGWAAFPCEASAEFLQEAIDASKDAPEPANSVAVVRRMRVILGERRRVGNFVRLRVEPSVDVELAQRVAVLAVELGNRLRANGNNKRTLVVRGESERKRG